MFMLGTPGDKAVVFGVAADLAFPKGHGSPGAGIGLLQLHGLEVAGGWWMVAAAVVTAGAGVIGHKDPALTVVLAVANRIGAEPGVLVALSDFVAA
jgi:hypothetical protein